MGTAAAAVSSVVSNSVRPPRRQPTRLPHPWDSPGKNTGVGCHFLLQCMKVKSEREVTQSCPTLSNPMDCSLPGSSVHGIFQARVLEWVVIASLSTVKFERYSEAFCWVSNALILQLTRKRICWRGLHSQVTKLITIYFFIANWNFAIYYQKRGRVKLFPEC